jgi:hypothetical protein
MKDHFATKKDRPDDYFALGNNCVNFVIEGMKKADVEIPRAEEIFSKEQLDGTGLAGIWARASMNTEQKLPSSIMEKEGFITDGWSKPEAQWNQDGDDRNDKQQQKAWPEISPNDPLPGMEMFSTTTKAPENSETRVNFIFDQDSTPSQSFAELVKIPDSPEASYNNSPLNPMPDSGLGDSSEILPAGDKTQGGGKKSPETQAFSSLINQEMKIDPRSLLLKDPKGWTEDERDMVMNYRFDCPCFGPKPSSLDEKRLQPFFLS